VRNAIRKSYDYLRMTLDYATANRQKAVAKQANNWLQFLRRLKPSDNLRGHGSCN